MFINKWTLFQIQSKREWSSVKLVPAGEESSNIEAPHELDDNTAKGYLSEVVWGGPWRAKDL